MSKPTNAQRALAHVQRLQEAGVKGIHDSEGLTAFPLEDRHIHVASQHMCSIMFVCREHGGAPDHHVLVVFFWQFCALNALKEHTCRTMRRRCRRWQSGAADLTPSWACALYC
ncbi:MAG: hypothetical protein MHM6MM_008690 [Cercozoa sp. M6MM]